MRDQGSSAAARILEMLEAGERRPFLITDRGTVSFRRMAEHVERFCALYDAEGVARGARVVILTRDETAAIAAFLAALLDARVPVLLTPETPAARADAIAARTGAAFAVADAGSGAVAAVARQVTIEPPGRSLFGTAGPDAAIAAALKKIPRKRPEPPEDPQALAYLLFTSGTTAGSKGVMVSHRNLGANLATLSRLFGYDRESRIFNGMVLAHADGLVQGPLLALYNGCALVRPRAFTADGMEDWLNAVRRHRATHFITVPTVYALIDRYARHDDYFEAPECRALLSVAAKLDEGLWRRLEERFGRPVFNQYGLTETVASALYAGPHPEMGGMGTIGRPVDVEARLVPPGPDPDANPDQGGELQLKGENVFPGYWDDAEASAAAFTGDGWFRTGDLARRLDDGAYQYLGRLKTVIMSGGFLIRPEEIDEALLRHASVLEATTVALEDPDFGEIAASAVVLDGTAGPPPDEAALAAHCRAWLEPLKLPKRIIAVDEIPRGDAGKPRLAPLRETLAAHLAGPAGQQDGGDQDVVLAIAAEVFRLPRAELSAASKAEDIEGWDSFTHLNLILRVEQSLSLRLPTSDVARIRSLGDLIDAVGRVR